MIPGREDRRFRGPQGKPLVFWSSFAANGAPDEWPVITGHAAMLFPDSPRRPYVVSGFKELACNAWDQAQQSGVVLRGI